MKGKSLIIHITVIHRGYLDFFRANIDKISNIYLINEELLEGLSEFKPDIASIDTEEAKELLKNLGFENISILSPNNIEEIKEKDLIFIQDEISRNLYNRYLQGKEVEWVSVFLRWDKEKVLSEKPPEDVETSKDSFDTSMMKEARKEAQKTGDWWRQVGAVLVKNGEILIRGYNRDLPSDHTPYQVGEVRDFLKAGERHELASTIHAEENIIAQAAKKGISLEGTSIYVTVFPCPVCAKLIAFAGIKNLYFGEGGSNFDAKKVLDSAGVNIIYVKCNNI